MGAYSVFDPGVSRPLNELSRGDARAAFERLMAAKADRINVLGHLLEGNEVVLADSDRGLQDLNDWFRTSVEADASSPGRLQPRWYSVVNDVALFIGDAMISRCPSLRWSFYDAGAKDVSFQRHVIMGFTSVPNPKYNIDVDRLVATYGHRKVTGQDIEGDAFWRWVRTAELKA